MTLLKLVLLVMLLLTAAYSALGFQKPGGRPTPTPAPTSPKGPGSGSAGPQISKPLLANMTILAPVACRIWIDEVEIDSAQPTLLLNRQRIKISYVPGSGMVTLKGL